MQSLSVLDRYQHRSCGGEGGGRRAQSLSPCPCGGEGVLHRELSHPMRSHVPLHLVRSGDSVCCLRGRLSVHVLDGLVRI